MVALDSSSIRMMSALFRRGPMSRVELHQVTDLHPNTVGRLTGQLIQQGLVRSCGTQAGAGGRGRPKEPLEIDPDKRCVLGIALLPGKVQALRMNLLGHWLEQPHEIEIPQAGQLVNRLAGGLRKWLNDRVVAVALSIPGFVDPQHRQILFSSTVPDQSHVDLSPIFELVGDRPVLMDNDLHALGAHWLLTQEDGVKQDVLLVSLGDGAVGASVMIQGQANPGCILAGNEIGHMRLNVPTRRCYCGGIGCLERVFSSAFLQDVDEAPNRNLARCLHPYQQHFPGVKQLTELVGLGLANAVNLIRPHRLVLAGTAAGWAEFHTPLIQAVQNQLLPELGKRVRIDWWAGGAACAAESAGWLALRSLLVAG